MIKSFKNFIKEEPELLLMSAASDRFEHDVVNSLVELGLDASRPRVDSTYSDVLIKYKGKKIWLEVKMNHTDNLGNTRASYDGKNWVTAPEKAGPLRGKMGPLKVYIADMLKKHADKFVKDIENFTGKTKINTNKGPQQRDPETVSYKEMKEFMKTQPDQYIVTVPNQPLGKVVVDHYSKGGKSEAAYYLQAGDDFYMLGKENPLNVPNDVPQFKGTGDFRMRVSIRSSMYEIQPEVKVKSMGSSEYSIAPNTKKKNPFEHLRKA